MDNKNNEVINEMLHGIDYLINEAVKETTQVYDGLVVGRSNGNKWKVRFNNGDHLVKQYGPGEPDLNMIVKVFVPQGNQNLSWFFVPSVGGGGGPGINFATFDVIPSTGELVMYYADPRTIPTFTIDNDGNLEVTINA